MSSTAGPEVSAPEASDTTLKNRVQPPLGSEPEPATARGAIVRQIAGLPDVLRPEPRAGAVGGAPVEWRAQDHHVGARVGRRVRPVTPGHAQKRYVRAVTAGRDGP